MLPPRPWWAVVLLCFCTAAHGATDALGFLDQSFFFDYNVASQAVPVPVTTQCDTIHLEWSRGAGVGPDPTAPYFLQIYTSAFVFPFVVSAGSGLSFDWQVPFGPGTLYQICMFDSQGNSGGCQGLYTMIANTTATPSCNNVTFPLGPLDVDAVVNSGPISQYGWIDECTDISVTPKNGTPPYIFTAAPTLHPPFNITSKDNSAMNWTVNLSWGSPFFISVVDADMNFWAYGPLHSGKGTTTACLSGPSSSSPPKKVSSWAAITSGVGGTIVGLIAGALATFLFFRHKRKLAQEQGLLDPTGSNGYSTNPYPYLGSTSAATAHYKAIPSGHSRQDFSSASFTPSANSVGMRLQRESTNYQIEPFTPPNADEMTRNGSYTYGSDYHDPHAGPASPTTPGGAGSGGGTGGGNIYVVHHDAGRPPVTVYHQDGVEVVELPPRYAQASDAATAASTAGSDAPGPSERRSAAVASSASERRLSLHSAQDIIAPLRRPNRPAKPSS